MIHRWCGYLTGRSIGDSGPSEASRTVVMAGWETRRPAAASRPDEMIGANWRIVHHEPMDDLVVSSALVRAAMAGPGMYNPVAAG
jgi:hypothetical protein